MIDFKPTSPEGNAAYRNGLCKRCCKNRYQAGSTMCAECWPISTGFTPTYTDLYAVTLTEREWAQCVERADEWVRVNKTNGAREKRKDGGKLTRPELLGCVSEFGFAKLFGLEPDWGTVLKPHAPDFVIRGKRVDIKSTDIPHGQLICSRDKYAADADIYVHAVIEPSSRTVRFKGWAFSREFINREHLEPLGARQVLTYVCKSWEVRQMRDLEHYLRLRRVI